MYILPCVPLMSSIYLRFVSNLVKIHRNIKKYLNQYLNNSSRLKCGHMKFIVIPRKVLKRLVDILGALVGLIILSPVMLVVAVVVYVSMGPPVLFKQERAGLNGRPFMLYKFRTMLDLRDEHGNLLPDEKRLTRVGRFLRNWSLDELPQFWNVLKGDMSLVGPRPLPTRYLPRL